MIEKIFFNHKWDDDLGCFVRDGLKAEIIVAATAFMAVLVAAIRLK